MSEVRKSYATDLLDSEWAYLRFRLSELPKTIRTRTQSLRDIFDVIFYVLTTGATSGCCPMTFHLGKHSLLSLPRIPPEGDMAPYLCEPARGREKEGWQGCRGLRCEHGFPAHQDHRAVRQIGLRSLTRPCHGYDAHKNVKGRKRHVLVDILGQPLSVYVTSANVQDQLGARLLLAGLAPLVPRLKKIGADGV